VEALTPVLRLGTFSWIVTCDLHKKILNSQPSHRLRTAGLMLGADVCKGGMAWLLTYKSNVIGSGHAYTLDLTDFEKGANIKHDTNSKKEILSVIFCW